MKKAIALVSSAAPFSRVLEEKFEVIHMPPDCEIDLPVSTHPDMICTAVGERIFFPKSYAERYPSVVEKISSLSGLEPVLSTSPRGKKYPFDVSLNTAVIENTLLCRRASASSELLVYAQNLCMTVLDTKQGYAGCSCLVCENHVYTGDRGIFALLEKHGINCTIVSEDIVLEGYDCGFIGGCGGYFDGKTYLYGSQHGEYPNCVDLADGKLHDYGGIKFLPIK